ncbi:glycosyltransferase family 4 protein [Shewanella algae]|uniref:glycosyltransferase family 4 protein n=1 Tax=Shewanella algae TaxID=38313 RepID=UPI001AADAC6B|nr:glycosyltransferase family 4 protein [Shewanella algae]MBO2653283.1 glycosyltransferase family 4 protein [Shewanella algae]
MKLALIIDDYLPDSTRVAAKMFHELAIELRSRGHNVTVITPAVRQKHLFVEEEIDGVNVWRFRSGAIKNVGKITRALNETLLSYNAWQAIRSKVNNDSFNGVVYYSPSIFFGGLVSKIKRVCKCSSYLVLRDLFPQWIIDAGMIQAGSLIERYFRFFEHYSYRQANVIGLMSDKNIEVFRRANGERYQTEVLRNWAALTPYIPERVAISLRQKLGLEDKVIYFYGGNIGHAQDMANLMRLAKGMRDFKKAHFLFVGQGDEVELINSMASDWKLENFTYLPSVTQDEFKQILADIDIGLFSLSSSHTAHNFPGKLLGYMVQSLPILGSVNVGNDLLELINQHAAGFISINGNDEELLNNAILLYEDAVLRKQIGMNSFLLLEREFAVSTIAQNILEGLRGAQ